MCFIAVHATSVFWRLLFAAGACAPKSHCHCLALHSPKPCSGRSDGEPHASHETCACTVTSGAYGHDAWLEPPTSAAVAEFRCGTLAKPTLPTLPNRKKITSIFDLSSFRFIK